MKKYISLALVLGMLLTLVGIIPAEAKVYTDYPYIYSDFEDPASVSDFTPAGAESQWVEEGAKGTSGSVRWVQKKAEVADLKFPLKDARFMLTGKFKMSAWIKLETDVCTLKDSADKMNFIFWGPAIDKDGKVTTTSWQTGWNVDKLGLNSGEWVYVEKVMSWDGAMRHGTLHTEMENAKFEFAPRVGDTNGVLKNSLASGTELSYLIDDFIVEPVLDEYVPNTEEPTVDFFEYMDFSDSNLSTYKISGSLNNLKHNGENGPDGKAGYVSYKSTVDQKVFADIMMPAYPFNYNKLYKFSFWAKADDDDTVGSRASICLMRDGRLDFTNDVGVYGGSNKYHYLRFPNDLSKDWKYYEVYMKRNVRTFDEKSVKIQFRVGNTSRASAAGVQEGQEGVAYSIDDFKIEELSVPSNGDFEWLKSDIPATDVGNGQSDDSYKYGTFYSWFQSGATVEESSDVPTDSAGKKSAKITTTEANGGINQGVYIENNVENEFTFWAKGEGDSVGKNIQIKLDRTVANKDAKDVYEVPDTELLGEGLALTDQWKKYTIPYNSAFSTPAGADPNAGPRQPFMSFVVDGGAAGLTYYVDDVAIAPKEAPKPDYQLPYATNLSLESTNVVGGTATFRYDFQTELENVFEGNSVVRVMKELADGSSVTLAQLSASTNIYEYIIPESAIGGTLRFEIMPFTEGGVAGAVYKISADDMVKTAFTITPTLGEFDAASGSITGSLFVENNKADDSDMNMFLAIILYDEDNGVVRFDSKPISVTKGNSDTITLSVTTADDPELKPIVKAKAFVWGGTGIFDTDMVSYADVIEVTK
mgnify:CR=1 FL=1